MLTIAATRRVALRCGAQLEPSAIWVLPEHDRHRWWAMSTLLGWQGIQCVHGTGSCSYDQGGPTNWSPELPSLCRPRRFPKQWTAGRAKKIRGERGPV